MANFLYKLGSFIARHKWWSVVVWVLLLAAIVTPLSMNSPDFDNDIEMNDLKSLDTNDKIGEEFNQDSEKASARIVFKSNSDNGITEKSMEKDIKETLKDIEHHDDYVENVVDPFESDQINDEETAAIADIHFLNSQSSLKDESIDNINKYLDELKDDHMVQTEIGGTSMSDIDVGGASEVVGIVVAFIVLLVTFGTFIAAGMPIISALLGLGSSIGIIALLTYTFDIPDITLTLAIMIGLAVGIDYALFILFRYRKIIKTETDHIKAIGLAVGTAGSAVVFAGITVIIAVCGLSLIGIDFLAVMGFASAISVLFAVLSALTLLPALISIFYKRIRPKRNKETQTDSVDTPWSKFIVGKPALAVFIGIIILGLSVIPMSNMRLGMPDDSIKPDDSTQKKAYEVISDEFGEGYNGQIVMLVNTKDKETKDATEKDLDNMRDDLKDFDSVDTVEKAQLNENNNYALISIVPEEGPNAKSTNSLVYDLRDYNKEAEDQYNFETEVSGQSVINIDMSKKLNDAIPVFAGVIVSLAFILLMVVFRSILIPLKAVLGFVLSLTATLGFTTLVMQEGFLSELFGVTSTGPLLAFLPVITIGILFGLAIDYELFLMTRIHEEYTKTGDNDHSIKTGIKESGPVIVAAALIMFSVFIAFVFQDDVMIKSIGLALAVGVLFDAFIVRMMLIPALTKLFGEASWYLPKWLQHVLPKIDIEGHALQEDNLSRKDEAIPEDVVNDTGLSQPLAMQDLQMNNQTMQLYNDLLKNTSNPTTLFNSLIYNALMQYAKDHDRDVFDKYNANGSQDDEKQPKLKQDTQSETSEEELRKMVEQQNDNIEKINDILSKLADEDQDDEEK